MASFGFFCVVFASFTYKTGPIEEGWPPSSMGSGVSRPWGQTSPKGYRDSRKGVLGGSPYPALLLLAWPGQKQGGQGKNGPVGDARASAETSALLLLLSLLPLPLPLPPLPLPPPPLVCIRSKICA